MIEHLIGNVTTRRSDTTLGRQGRYDMIAIYMMHNLGWKLAKKLPVVCQFCLLFSTWTKN